MQNAQGPYRLKQWQRYGKRVQAEGPGRVRWVIQSAGVGLAAMEARAQAELARLHAEGPAAQLAALMDPRPLHRALFADVAPPDMPEAAGTWRGTPGTGLAGMRRAVFVPKAGEGVRRRHLCHPPEAVAEAMAALAGRVEALWQGGADGGEQAALDALAEFLARFFLIHPFADGNGHVGRLLAVLLAGRLGLAAGPGWTLAHRPYGPTMSLCLQWYAAHPALLADHLRRWFRWAPRHG